MRAVLPTLTILLTPALLAAQGILATRTVPASAATAEGNSFSYYPFLYNKGRTQHLIDGKSFCTTTGILQEIGYRRDGDSSRNMPGRTITTFKVSLGYSANSAATMSTTFASNRSGAQTVIFNGTYNLPNNPPVTGLAPWNMVWKITQPFIYQIAKGNLLIEFEVPGQANQKSEYYVDGHRIGGPGLYTVFGTRGPFASNDLHSLRSVTANLKPGGSADLEAVGLKKAYPAIVVYGFSKTQYGPLPLPLDLKSFGAPQNYLYVSMDITWPLTLTQSGSTFRGTVRLPLPNVPALGGAFLHGTAIYYDPPSNAMKLVFSHGVSMLLASSGKGPSQSLGQQDSNTPTGNFQNPAGTNAPVIRLTGSFN